MIYLLWYLAAGIVISPTVIAIYHKFIWRSFDYAHKPFWPRLKASLMVSPITWVSRIALWPLGFVFLLSEVQEQRKFGNEYDWGPPQGKEEW